MTVTRYIWDELSDSVVMESDDKGNVTTYTHQPGLYGKVLSQNRNGVNSYYHYDGQGNVRQLTDSSGAVTDEMTYTAFGEVVEKTGTTVNPWGYKGAMGYYANPGTDDLYVRARTLSPVLGRWLSTDPVEHEDGLSKFVYVENDPLGNDDPSGLAIFKPIGGQCDIVSQKTYIEAVCVFSKQRANAAEWKEIIACPEARPFACCVRRADGVFRTWAVINASLQKRIVTKTRCSGVGGSVGGVGLVKTCPKPAVTGGGGGVGIGQVVVVAVDLIPILIPQTKTQVQIIKDPPSNKQSWKGSANARGVCPEGCGVFKAVGPSKKECEDAALAACEAAGCTVKDEQYSCQCAHANCIRTS
ncbi:MAG: RHS repeat-associated core domain-containing protein [Planctomycetales bacterium]|nr:RHS repeat-associated core domain-containing protein [Planctomycetales bacterium]